MRKHHIFIILLFFTFSTLFAQPYTPTSSGEVINHKYYSLSYIEEHEQPQWVYYHLTSQMIGGDAKRKNNFRADPSVSTRSASLNDYKASGYDRGHLCSAADMSFSDEAMSESFFMSNMSPQAPSFNRGKWKQFETQVREWAVEKGEVYVVTGPIFRDNIGVIGEGVTVPGYYYKIIYDPAKEIFFAAIMPNEKLESELSAYATSVDEIEELTSIDFFPQLPDEISERIEAVVTSPYMF